MLGANIREQELHPIKNGIGGKITGGVRIDNLGFTGLLLE